MCTSQKSVFEWYLKSGEVSSSSIYILLGPSSRLAYSESILPKQLQLIIQQLLKIEGVLKSNPKMSGASRANTIILIIMSLNVMWKAQKVFWVKFEFGRSLKLSEKQASWRYLDGEIEK